MSTQKSVKRHGTRSTNCVVQCLFFYRNGFEGETMLQSTDISHKFHIWDRQEEDNREVRQIEIENETYFLHIEGLPHNNDEGTCFVVAHQHLYCN